MISLITSVILPLFLGRVCAERVESVKFMPTEATKHAPKSSDRNEILMDVTIVLLRINVCHGLMTRRLQAARLRSSHISNASASDTQLF